MVLAHVIRKRGQLLHAWMEQGVNSKIQRAGTRGKKIEATGVGHPFWKFDKAWKNPACQTRQASQQSLNKSGPFTSPPLPTACNLRRN